jgi:hypothetical protein
LSVTYIRLNRKRSNLGFIHNRSIIERQHNRYCSLNLVFSTIEYSIKYVDPRFIIKRTLKPKGSSLLLRDIIYDKTLELDLNDFNCVYLVGAGKATAGMAEAPYRILKWKSCSRSHKCSLPDYRTPRQGFRNSGKPSHSR